MKYFYTFLFAILFLLGFGGNLKSQVSNYSLSTVINAYVTISSTGTPLAITGGGGAFSAAIPIGFNFTFDGTVYTSFKASEDGYITFNPGATATASVNDLDNTPAINRPLIAPLWDDQEGKQAYYEVVGTAPNRFMIIEWHDWEWNVLATAPIISYQIRLMEGSNNIEFAYYQATTAANSPSASIGLSGVSTFFSLQNTSIIPPTSTTVENSTISTKPATGTVYILTSASCNQPNAIATSGVTTTSAVVSWTSGGASNWDIEYGPTGFTLGTGTFLSNVSNPYTLTGLTAGTTYDVYVRDSCGVADVSNWSGPSALVTSCLPSSNVQVVPDSIGSLLVSWTQGGGISWNLEYGLSPLVAGTGTMVFDVTSSYRINGLSNNTSYDVIIQDSCDAANLSDWTTNVSATTLLPSGIDEAAGKGFSLSPNPATNELTLNLNNASLSSIKISLINITGVSVFQKTVNNSPANWKETIDVSMLESGVYFFKLSNAAGVNVQRVIIQ